MYSISTIDLKILAAEQFIESVSEPAPNTTMYIAYGRIDSWANEPLPEVANSSVATEYQFWKSMIGAKRLTGNDIRHVIPRTDWNSGTIYTSYDHLDDSLFNDGMKFYVINSEYGVYKCIDNNNGANSIYEPLTVSTNTTIQTADGYIWKYMYSLSDLERQRFTTGSFIPIRTLDVDNGSRQWDVQQNAIDGAIHSIIVTRGGNNYTNVSNLIVTISGDGAGATAQATINTYTNTVNSVYMTSIGTGYTQATVSISGGGGDGTAASRVVISPKGGHGSDPIHELGGKYLLINGRIMNHESNVLPVVNDYRQIALISDPLLRQSNTRASNTAVSQTTDLTVAGESANYQLDEWVYQGRNLQSATFKGKVVSWSTLNSLIRLTEVEGTPSTESLVGSNSAASRFVSSYKFPDLERYSGKLLYINNISPITRNLVQTEDFKIIIKF